MAKHIEFVQQAPTRVQVQSLQKQSEGVSLYQLKLLESLTAIGSNQKRVNKMQKKNQKNKIMHNVKEKKTIYYKNASLKIYDHKINEDQWK